MRERMQDIRVCSVFFPEGAMDVFKFRVGNMDENVLGNKKE